MPLSWNEIKDRAYQQMVDYFPGLKLPVESVKSRRLFCDSSSRMLRSNIGQVFGRNSPLT
jgi:hypothetical protein